MSFIGTSLLVMIFVSCLFALLSFGLERLCKSFRHWPMLWATLLLGTALAPVFVAIRMHAPNFLAEPASQLTASVESLGIAWPALVEMPGVTGSGLGSSLLTVFSWVYLAGLGLLMLRLVIGRLRIERLSLAAIKVTLQDGTVVRIANETCTPFALKPLTRHGERAVVVPTYLLKQAAADELGFIVRHEQAHLDRRDDELGLVLRIACALSWPIPFAWVFLRRWQDATEIRCDAIASRGHTKRDRNRFARTLVKVHEYTSHAPQHPVASTLIGNPLRSEKMRLNILLQTTSLTRHKRSHQLVLVICAAVLVTMASGAFSPLALADGEPKRGSSNMRFDFVDSGRLSSRFGLVAAPGSSVKKRQHSGIDIAAPHGTPLLAPTAGVITLATELYKGKAAYGKVMILQIDERTQLMFAHLDSFDAQVGDQVREGERIAFIGNTGRSTGPHVHIEARVDGELVDPLLVVRAMQHGGIDRWASL